MYPQPSIGAHHPQRLPQLGYDPSVPFDGYPACPTCHGPLRGPNHFDPRFFSPLEFVEAQQHFIRAHSLYGPSSSEGYNLIPSFENGPVPNFPTEATVSHQLSSDQNGQRRDPDKYLKALYLNKANRTHEHSNSYSDRSTTTSMTEFSSADSSSETQSSSSRAPSYSRSSGPQHDPRLLYNHPGLDYSREVQYNHQTLNFTAGPTSYHNNTYLDNYHPFDPTQLC